MPGSERDRFGPTDRTMLLNDAARVEERLQLALSASSTGIFDHDLQTGTIYCSPELRAMYEFPPDRLITLETFDQRAHPDDRDARARALALAHDPAGDGQFKYEYRILREDGSVGWVHVKARTYFEGAGRARRAVRVIGAATDVTESKAADQRLREREARLRRAEVLTRCGHFMVDDDRTNIFSSEGNHRLWGFRPGAELQAADYAARIHPDDVPRLDAAFDQSARDGKGFEIEFRIRPPDAAEVIARSLVECEKDVQSGRVRFFGTTIDVTAQKQAEAALAASDERLRQAVHLGRLGIFDHDHRTDTSYWSPEQREIWRLRDREDVPVASLFQYVHPADLARVKAAVARSHDADGDGGYDIEHRIVTRDGKVRWIHTRAQTYFDGVGTARHAVRTVGATADTTERKQVEIDLRIKDDALASAVAGILICGADGRISYVNAAWLRMYGYSRENEILGTTPHRYVADPEQHPRMLKVLAETGHFLGEVTARRRDGSTFEGELAVSVIADAAGAPAAYLGSILDVTERRRADVKLRQSEAMLRSLFEASRDAIVVTQNQRILLANHATAAMYGFDSPADMVGLPMSRYVAPSELGRVIEINRGREAGLPVPTLYETRGIRPDGSEFDTEISGSNYTIDGVSYPLVMIRDITARKAAETALREGAERLSLVFNNTTDAQLLFQVEGDGGLRIVSANRAYKDVSRDLFPDLPTEFEGLLREEMLASQGYGAQAIEMEMPAFRQVIDTGTSLTHEMQLRLPNGETAIIEAHLEPVLDGEGRCTHVLWVGRNVSERWHAQEAVRRMNAELEQRVAERTAQLEAANKELEAFAYSISHDLRAPARALDGYAGILTEDYGTRFDAEGLRLCGVIRSEAQRLGRLIDDLLRFSRLGRTAMRMVPVDMTALVQGVIEELVPASDPGRIACHVAPLPPVLGDGALLRQVWVNLLANAVKFTGRRPAAVIDVSGRVEGHEAIYTVADNGAGFDMAYQEKLFGVFQRLHTDHEFLGTGVGLAIVQRVIHRHGGRVWAEGQVDHGARFSFALPLEGLGA